MKGVVEVRERGEVPGRGRCGSNSKDGARALGEGRGWAKSRRLGVGLGEGLQTRGTVSVVCAWMGEIVLQSLVMALWQIMPGSCCV